MRKSFGAVFVLILLNKECTVLAPFMCPDGASLERKKSSVFLGHTEI
jgi:hypothetical protein